MMKTAICRFMLVLMLGSAASWWAQGLAAQGFTPSSQISFTLEGCRNDGTIRLPINGQFVCPDSAYTTGNLGKGWNELDLVPHRLTTQAGNQISATTDYNVYLAADYQTSGRTGYDIISVPLVNTAKSHPSCIVTAGPQSTQGSAASPFGGGTDAVIYRQLSIHQEKGTTCVFDYYERLALGSHLYPGSSLQSYMFDQAGLSGSKKTISIPVNQIQPQSLSKDMSATQGSDSAWDIRKNPAPNALSFGDVCAPNPLRSLGLSLTVTWTKGPATPGGITVITHVYVTNPAARAVTANVTDVIYSGTTPLNAATSGPIDVPPNTANFLVLTHPYVAPASTTDLNDVATATYTDTVTGIPIPGNTRATASATVQITQTNTTASILDVESITGNGLTFSVATPSFGSFDAYSPGTQTVGPVNWRSGTQNAGNTITFNKTVYLDTTRVTSGSLTNSATLTGSDGFATGTGPVNVNISSSASPRLTISKTIPSGLLSAAQTVIAYFKVTRTNDPAYLVDNITLTFSSGTTSQSTVITGPAPDYYVVTETKTLFFPAGCLSESCAFPASLSPLGGSSVTVNLSKDSTTGVLTKCSETASFTNVIPDTFFPSVQVRKATLPNTDTSTWTFTLRGPGVAPGGVTVDAVANSGYVKFGVSLLQPGTYTVTENTKNNWYLNSASPNDTAHPTVCTFTAVFPSDFVAGKVFNCDFQNTQQYAAVLKTVQGQPPSGPQAFTFQLRQGASTTQSGTTLETQIANAANGGSFAFSTLLAPGQTYQICEIVMPGWLTTLGTFVPNSFIPPDGVASNPAVDNSILCGNFTVDPGQTKTFTVDNSPPPGGRALTIGFWKNWASCKASGGNQAPILDQTMALATPPGIAVDGFYLLGSQTNPNAAPDCRKAVNLLSKSTMTNGSKKASDPLFNMTAQLLAAELNMTAGAGTCGPVLNAIQQANALLTLYKFSGDGYQGKLSPADATLANNLARRLDNYNNDRPQACQ